MLSLVTKLRDPYLRPLLMRFMLVQQLGFVLLYARFEMTNCIIFPVILQHHYKTPGTLLLQ